jgi:NAD-dependent DNA ligase
MNLADTAAGDVVPATRSMVGETVVFSGCRDKTLKSKLEKAGARVSSSGASILIVKSKDAMGSAKAKAAVKNGARVMDLSEALECLGLDA